MPRYQFEINKGDHFSPKGAELHVHVYYNEGRGRRLMGRYRLPELEPVFHREPKLNQAEIKEIKEWLTQPSIIKKLNDFLKETLFDIHKIAKFGEVRTDKEGKTCIVITIPVTKRLGTY